jgi:hypothetical protein
MMDATSPMPGHVSEYQKYLMEKRALRRRDALTKVKTYVFTSFAGTIVNVRAPVALSLSEIAIISRFIDGVRGAREHALD